MAKAILYTVLMLFLSPAVVCADLADELEDLEGYTIVDSKDIEGWYDPGSSSVGEDFEGCDYGRVIVFDDDTSLTCDDYGYNYDIYPTAVILVRRFKHNGREFYKMKMVVGDDIYDMM